jgi:hypothetical protein
MRAIYHYVLWVLELVSLIVILVCAWNLLDREVFALVAASVTLITSLYMEYRTERTD